jgi:hypothetical protein
MRDLRTRLERIGERAKAAPDAFERLERARRRHERNRRITAGTVALMVAVFGSVAVFTAFRTNDAAQIGAAGEEGFHALWPESTIAAAESAQAAVESGDPDLQWRLDPEDTAAHFAREVLLLGDGVTIDGMTPVTDDGDQQPGPVRFHIVTVSQTCPPWSDVDDGTCAPSAFTVELARLLGPAAIWSVTMVESPDFRLFEPPGARIGVGTVELETSLPEGTIVQTGFSTTDACALSDERSVEVSGRLVNVELPEGLAGCDGYLYAIAASWLSAEAALDDRPIGGIMFGALDPGVAYQLWSMAALPVRFEDVVPQQPIDVVEFTCDETGTIAPSDATVEAQPDGVHVAITDEGDVPVSFSVGELGGDGAEPGQRKETVWQLPPGNTIVSCSVASESGGGVASSASLNVVDPAGSYVTAELDCPGAASSQISDYVEGAVGVQGDPVEVARQHFSGLEFDDLVERAGYPESEPPVVRVVRRGDVVASATFMLDGQGGWLLESLEVCYGVPIAWSEGTTGVSGPMGPTSTAWDVLCASARAGEGNNIHNGRDLHVEGRDLDFDTGCLIAPAGDPLTILFNNLDGGVHMNISIYALTPYLRECLVTGTSPSGKVEHRIFSGEIILGVDEIVYEVGPLEPGAYYFQDDVHPSANGVLVVE